MNPKQLNGNAEFGSCARQQHRFYSVFFGAACLQTGNADRSVTKILKLYEKDTDHARLQTPPTPILAKSSCLTTEMAHRTNSYGLPHVMILLEE
jgi:hypothetical protein